MLECTFALFALFALAPISLKLEATFGSKVTLYCRAYGPPNRNKRLVKVFEINIMVSDITEDCFLGIKLSLAAHLWLCLYILPHRLPWNSGIFNQKSTFKMK